MSKKFIAMLMAFVIVLSLVCTGCANDTPSASSDETITFVDGGGTEVTIPKNVTKIACWSSTIESVVIGLGACDKLASSEYFDESHKWMYEMFPEMNDISKTASGEWNAETMLSMGVEVVLVKNAKNAETMRNAGLTAVHLDFTTIEATIESIKLIGLITGKEEQANKCAELLAYYDELVSERLAGVDDATKPIIYYNICRNNTPDSVLNNTYSYGCFDTVWIEKAGGKVVSEGWEIGEGLVEINLEELYSADPDYIFVSGVYQEFTYSDLVGGNYDELLTAVKNGNVIRVPQGIYDWGQAGVETCLVTIWAAKTLYPDLFADIDMHEIAADFYKDVVGVELNDDQIAAILNGQNGSEGK